MRVFVTGASGWIGSAVVPELIAHGHQVLGLARSDESARAVAAAGAEVQRGSLDDLDSLRAGAAASDGVIHLAYVHDFSNIVASGAIDRRAVEALGSALEGTGKPLVTATGLAVVRGGEVATEQDPPDPRTHRAASDELTLSLADRGVRAAIVRLAGTVHGDGDPGFIATLVKIARETGVSGYIGDGANRWPAVHVRDAAILFRLAAEQAPGAAVLHGVADEGVPTREIAAAIGRGLGVPVASIAPDRAAEHFGWMSAFFGLDLPASSALTRQRFGWEPTHPSLMEDLQAGYYFADTPVAGRA